MKNMTLENQPVVTKRLGDLVRAEAKRRGGQIARRAGEYARRAEAMFGERPLRGAELRLVFEEVIDKTATQGGHR